VRTIAIVNQKGGCGKTTTAINLAAIYARRGLRTLVVDMDPQSHCALGLGVPEERVEYSIGDALVAEHLSDAQMNTLFWEVSRNLHLAPSTMRLAGLESPGGGLHARNDRDRRLELLLGRVGRRFDRCLIDCPPTVGLLTFNALRAAREALIPVETGFFALRGADKQWKTIQRVIKHIGRPIACHLVATMHREESSVAAGILHTLRRQFAGQIVPVVIREHAVLREAASFGQPIIEYAPGSEAQSDFENLVDWLEEHAAGPIMPQVEVMNAAALTDPATAAITDQHPGSAVEASGLPPSQPGAAPLIASPGALVASIAADLGTARTMPVPAHNGSNDATPAASRAAELARRVGGLVRRPAPMAHPEAAEAFIEHAPSPNVESIAISPAVISSIATSPPNAAGAAVAEMVQAVAEQSSDGAAKSGDPPKPRMERDSCDSTATPSPVQETSDRPAFGVELKSRGVVFRQPGDPNQRLHLAGDFNNWSGVATPLAFDPAANAHSVVVELPPGSYRYRVIIDGQWQIDRYNQLTHMNDSREINSLVVVPAMERNA